MRMYGSFQNRMAEVATKGAPTPTVGMGATQLGYSDRHAATITEVVTNREGKVTKIGVVRDHAKLLSGNILSESQRYEFSPGSGPPTYYTLRKNGAYVREGSPLKGGETVAIGYRDEYYDPSF